MQSANQTAPATVGEPSESGSIPHGHVWNGFEWVSVARYDQQCADGFQYDGKPLPPLPASCYEPVPAGYPPGPMLGEGIPPWSNEYVGGDNALAETDLPEGFGMVCHSPISKAGAREAAINLLLAGIGEDGERGGLLETPARAAKAWAEWTCGYGMDPAAVLKVFEDGADGCDEMVVVASIPVYSHCEHHLAPIFGTATVGYLPDKRIVGLSKLPRLVDIFARRLQVQERLTNQIANAIMEHLTPLGCGVVIRARHMCMESRGIKLAGTETVTSAMRGAFRNDDKVRAEFLALAHGG